MTSFPKQSSVYWFDPEPSKGSELRKVRPCIVVSPDEMNKSLRTVLIVPLTSTTQLWPFRTTVTMMSKKSSAACDQLRAVDTTRLKSYIADLRPIDRDNLYNVLQTIFTY